MSGLLDRLLRHAPGDERATRYPAASLSRPDAWLLGMLGADGNAAGVDVTPDSSLSWTALAAAIRVLSTTFAQLPLFVYQRRADGGKDVLRSHPAFEVLHTQANPYTSKFEAFSLVPTHGILWGDYFAAVEKDNKGQVVALWPMNPDRVRPTRNEGGNLVYVVTLDSTTVTMLADEVLHVPGFQTGGLVGRSLATDHADAIGLGLATERYGARFFSQGAQPGGYLQHPGKLSPEAKDGLAKSWNMAHQGWQQSHRVAVLEEAMEWKQLTTDPEKAQFMGLREFQLAEAVRVVTGVPPHLIGDLRRATFSNIEQQGQEFVTYGLQGWLTRMEQRLAMTLFTPTERRAGIFAEHAVQGLLRGDSAARATFYSALFNQGALSPNDIRALENRNPIAGGEQYFVPLNMVPLDQASSMPAADRAQLLLASHGVSVAPPVVQPPAPGVETRQLGSGRQRKQLRNTFAPLLAEVAKRLTGRELARLRQAATRLIRADGDTTAFEAWLVRWYIDDFPAMASELLEPTYGAYARAVYEAASAEVDAEPDEKEISRVVSTYVDTAVARHGAGGRLGTESALRSAAELQQPAAEALDAYWRTWTDESPSGGAPRMERMAGRDLIQLNGAATVAAWAAAGVGTYVWVSSGEETCPYCEELNGRTVSMGGEFLQQGQQYQPEGAERPLRVTSGIHHPPAHQGCDCDIQPG